MLRLLCCCATLLTFASSVSAGTSNSLMDLSQDGRLLACSNRDSGTVSIVDLQSGELLREVPVGRHPEGVCFLGATHQLVVAAYADDVVVVLNADTGEIGKRIDVDDEPYGVVASTDGSKVFVTLEFPGKVAELDVAAGKVSQEWSVGTFPRGIALNTDGLLYITEYLSGALKQFEPASGKVLNADESGTHVTEHWAGTPEDSLARQVALHPVSGKAYVPHQRSRVTVAHGAGSIFPYVTAINTQPDFDVEKKRRRRIQMDSFRGTYVVANPWEVALSPTGDRLYVVFSGTDDMFICDVLDDNYRELEYAGGLRLGANPRAVRVSADGSRFYVYNALDFTVVGYDAASLQQVLSTTVTSWPGTAEELLGKKLFYTANAPMTRQRWISCSSCHPDGDADGRTWQQPEGLRNTQAMLGLKHTHPIHWSADRDEVQDFEITIRSPLMQGRGLIKGKVNDGLGAPNAGLSAELDALAAYTNSHGFLQSPFAKQGLSESAQRGKELFFSATTKCAECHSGTYFTDLKMHDVGTAATDPTEKFGPEFDTPTLLSVYRSAPYLHHGQAATLEEVLTTHNPDDRHGVTSHLSPQQIADVVEYMKALPLEDMP
ncbi:MAG: c-type cytochrome [Planctomycetaceae bacterium]|nr:c-type cytochrome [Planctomycetaceae bacterium]